jgi:hypothetical protein
VDDQHLPALRRDLSHFYAARSASEGLQRREDL